MTRDIAHARRAAHRRGGALLEAALVLPILLALAFGTVEYGQFFFAKQSFQGAARDGARAAIVAGATNADVTNAVAVSLNAAGFGSSGYTVNVQHAQTDVALNVAAATAGTPVKVTVTCPWSTVGSGARPLNLIDTGVQVRGVVVMRKE